MNIKSLLNNPGGYWKASRFILAGWWFDVFLKTFKADGCSFEIPKSLTSRLGRGYFALNLYENAERELIKKHIQGNEKVIELGACIGVVSCIVNSGLADPFQHVVVEANPKLIPFLEKNKELNGCQFSIANCAVSLKSEEIFYFGDSIVSGSLVGRNDTRNNVVVRGKTFLELEQEFNVKFDSLIIDIEGGEYDFFLNNRFLLNRFNLIIIENHPYILSAAQITEYENLFLENGLLLCDEIETSKVWKRLVNLTY